MSMRLDTDAASAPQQPTFNKRSYFLSVVITNIHEHGAPAEIIKDIAKTLDTDFEFWEIIVAVDSTREDFAPLAEKLRSEPNVRFIVVRERVGTYRIRSTASIEAIGDTILITPIAEAALLDLPRLADESYTNNLITTYASGSASIIDKAPAAALGLLTGYQITPGDYHTTALPRTILNDLLLRDTADLELRFDRRQGGQNRSRLLVNKASAQPQRRRALDYRLSIFSDLIVAAAPRVLSILAGLSGLVFLSSLAYAVYVCAVYLTLPSVAPGWFTTSILLTSLTGFLALSILAISLGILGLYDRLREGTRATITEEINNTDLFSKLEKLNVQSDT